jgi:hypothetical protein
MNLTYLERKELNWLSKEVTGVESKWRTLVRKGVPKNMKQIAPKVWQSERRWFFTFEEVKAYLFEIKALKDKYIEDLKKKNANK